MNAPAWVIIIINDIIFHELTAMFTLSVKPIYIPYINNNFFIDLLTVECLD